MNGLGKRLAALEQAQLPTTLRWHCLRRYEGETDEQASAAYEAEHGPISDANVIMQVIVSKPGPRPSL